MSDPISVLGSGPARTHVPLENGEVVFEAPWEARVFGLAHALCDAGLFRWEDVREALIAEIGRWDATHGGRPESAPAYHYFERFQCALEALLAARGMTATRALEARARSLAARPHGHDH